MVSQLKWTFRSRSANNASCSHHRDGGVTHKGQVTASARQNKKWASLQDDRSATWASLDLERRILELFFQSLASVGRCSEDDHRCSANTHMTPKTLEVSEQKLRGHISGGTEARTQTKVAHTSLFPISSLLDALSIFTQYGRKDLAWRCPVKRVFSVPEALEKEFTFFSHSTGAMSGLRKHFNIGLVLLMCALTGHCGESAPSAAPVVTAAAAAGRDAQQNLRRIVEIMKHVEESRGRNDMKTEAPLISRDGGSPGVPKDLRNLKTDRGEKAVAVFPRDLRKKEKFLKHITGPLYFSPKCRKHVYRLYHHTRDCTIPAYFKRCARLLTRLAGSPQCTEG